MRRHWSRPLVTSISLGSLLCSTVGGCATLKFPDYPDVPAQELEYSVVKAGLTAGIDPLVESKEARKYFKANLPQVGILAVYTKLENGTGSTVLFENSQCLLVGLEGGADEGAVSSAAGGIGVTAVGALLISLPLLFIGMKIISDADNIKKNFAIKEFKRQTVSPGQSAGGFVYFQLPDVPREQWPDRWLMRISPKRIDGGPLPVLEISFPWNEE